MINLSKQANQDPHIVVEKKQTLAHYLPRWSPAITQWLNMSSAVYIPNLLIYI